MGTMADDLKEIAGRLHINIVRKVAQGGMSVVYEGRLLGCEGFEKTVAVKTLLPAWSEDTRFMKMFIDEAKLVSGLVHENIVQIYQLGWLPDGTYYIVMEFVEGLPLRQFLSKHLDMNTHPPEPLSVHIISRIARGLAYAHSFRDREGRGLEIVHRDVCPSNILITTEGLAKLTDFGVAKALPHTVIGDDWLTGKVAYMSPEQAARHPVDFRSDIFSLGAVMFELLSGVPIRSEDIQPQRVEKVQVNPPWEKLPATTDPEVLGILRRALAPAAEDRYRSAAEFARALEYHIYKDGYGPTIQTVEEYMRKVFPELYAHEKAKGAPAERISDPVTTSAKGTSVESARRWWQFFLGKKPRIR